MCQRIAQPSVSLQGKHILHTHKQKEKKAVGIAFRCGNNLHCGSSGHSSLSHESALHKTFYPNYYGQCAAGDIKLLVAQPGSTGGKLSRESSETSPAIFRDRHKQKILSILLLVSSFLPSLHGTTPHSTYRGTKATSSYLYFHGMSQDLKGLGRARGHF